MFECQSAAFKEVSLSISRKDAVRAWGDMADRKKSMEKELRQPQVWDFSHIQLPIVWHTFPTQMCSKKAKDFRNLLREPDKLYMIPVIKEISFIISHTCPVALLVSQSKRRVLCVQSNILEIPK